MSSSAPQANEPTRQQREFRSAMANLSAAVSIVTTDGPYGRAGITVSAACSVTDAPPTMLVCVNRSSYTHDFFLGNGRLCVNVLGAGHQDIAMRFAGRGGMSLEERFTDADWRLKGTGVPVLRDAVASVVGQITSHHAQGSHTVMFVLVDEVAARDDNGGLVYFQRRFHPLAAEPLTA
ncbi:flavin reductase [Streptomyces sp. S.PB5]|uniref:flavin reductase n=1 Tax=Streptomyces sp. S.PB5 TaxID=3020844 RepID=UPI0025B209DB|nr:flavin reductase [Streptomyces sp. S.PB5]MDN3028098.1 flavin reductase [Streptomyces sp. S.PB5]